MLREGSTPQTTQRVIFHVDMDAFFVSVEELYDPSLRGRPVVVGGQAHERGVVAAASYAARKFGIRSAMPLRTAYEKCPEAIFLDGHRDRYVKYSAMVKSVLHAFSPKVEMASIDEAYLDLTGTGRLYGPPLAAAHLLHERMKADTGLNCSIGIGTSRLVAKIGSGAAWLADWRLLNSALTCRRVFSLRSMVALAKSALRSLGVSSRLYGAKLKRSAPVN